MKSTLTNDNDVHTNDDNADDDYEDGSAAAVLLNSFNAEYLHDNSSDTTDSEMNSDELEDSIIAPPFSPICNEPLENFLSLKGDNDTVSSSEDEEVSEDYASAPVLPKRDTVGNSDDDTPLQEACPSYTYGAVDGLESQVQMEINESAFLVNSAPMSFSQISNGYKIIIDNTGKNIRPSYQRVDRSTFSLHYVHTYAALDRVDFSGLSDVRPTPMAVDLDKLLPLAVDVTEIENHFSILIIHG